MSTTRIYPQEMTSMDSQFPEFHGRVRFDEATKKGSVLDVVQVITGLTSGNSSVVFSRLHETYPELCRKFQKTRINGKVRYPHVELTTDDYS